MEGRPPLIPRALCTGVRSLSSELSEVPHLFASRHPVPRVLTSEVSTWSSWALALGPETTGGRAVGVRKGVLVAFPGDLPRPRPGLLHLWLPAGVGPWETGSWGGRGRRVKVFIPFLPPSAGPSWARVPRQAHWAPSRPPHWVLLTSPFSCSLGLREESGLLLGQRQRLATPPVQELPPGLCPRQRGIPVRESPRGGPRVTHKDPTIS